MKLSQDYAKAVGVSIQLARLRANVQKDRLADWPQTVAKIEMSA